MARFLIVEADGGSRGNPGPAGFGALVRDGKSGELLREIAETIGVASNNVAEYSGLIAGLSAAHEIDPTAEITVRMDSKLVIEQMSGRWQIKHPDMRELALKARNIHDRSLITYQWIPRAENSHADSLANKALDGVVNGSLALRRQQLFISCATARPISPPTDDSQVAMEMIQRSMLSVCSKRRMLPAKWQRSNLIF